MGRRWEGGGGEVGGGGGGLKQYEQKGREFRLMWR